MVTFQSLHNYTQLTKQEYKTNVERLVFCFKKEQFTNKVQGSHWILLIPEKDLISKFTVTSAKNVW